MNFCRTDSTFQRGKGNKVKSDNRPSISIIVPVYNVEAYLSNCVDSILSQTFRDFELILVDDGSPDRCGEMCDRYAETDPRVRVIHQANAGVAHARNQGLEYAQGEFITFCDSDDSIGPDHLETLTRLIRETDANSAVVSFIIVPENGDLPQAWPHWEGVSDYPNPGDRIEYLLQKIMSQHVGWEISIRLLQRSVIEENHIRFCETCGNFAEDLGFVIEYILCTQREVSANHPSYRYLQRRGSMMNNSRRIIKLNQVNEVSKFVYPAFEKIASQAKKTHSFTLLHAVILYNQLSRLLRRPDLAKSSFDEVADSAWMRKHLRGVLRHRRTLQKYYGKQTAWRIILLAHYARYQNSRLFRLERYLIDRLIVAID